MPDVRTTLRLAKKEWYRLPNTYFCYVYILLMVRPPLWYKGHLRLKPNLLVAEEYEEEKPDTVKLRLYMNTYTYLFRDANTIIEFGLFWLFLASTPSGAIRTWTLSFCGLVVGVRTSRSCPRGLRPCGRKGATVLAAIYTLGILLTSWARLPLLLISLTCPFGNFIFKCEYFERFRVCIFSACA